MSAPFSTTIYGADIALASANESRNEIDFSSLFSSQLLSFGVFVCFFTWRARSLELTPYNYIIKLLFKVENNSRPRVTIQTWLKTAAISCCSTFVFGIVDQISKNTSNPFSSHVDGTETTTLKNETFPPRIHSNETMFIALLGSFHVSTCCMLSILSWEHIKYWCRTSVTRTDARNGISRTFSIAFTSF